ncbi:MAG: phosphoribosylanthranilate isomerase [Saprospiraceae bacterium]|nr:phosphoribosylanthranilate isomerase [Saprospiraceae bacterium]
MKYQDNISAIVKCKPDFIGFIFYPGSPRFIDNHRTNCILEEDKSSQTVGVFVNSDLNLVIETVQNLQLDYVQLHGNESALYVAKLKEADCKIIKAFQMIDNFEWARLNEFTENISYFLFDTPSEKYGGSGSRFNWKKLRQYKENKGFFLSGGIAFNDLDDIRNSDIPEPYCIDINSMFEIEPGVKDAALVDIFIKKVKTKI